MRTATAWPMDARTNTPAMSTTVRISGVVSRLVQLWMACGTSHIASAPPPRKPARDRTLTTSPWRYPEIA